ncbi:MAG TPA: MerR family transcriptional regulator [Frankiaceae bacterium]|nr:MerR family transcriptional regulator [Frankiaceae bacterium]
MSSEAEAPVYTASAVAARLGVAVETLRTWDRRYGLGPGTRGPGGRRRYGEEDLARLLVMRRLVTSGMPTSEAARRAAGGGGGVPPVGVDAALPPTRRPRSGGGRVVAIPRGSTLQHGLARAATALDVDEVERLLEQVITDVGVAGAWDSLLRPVLVAVGERWARTGEGVEVEHLLSQAAMDVLRRMTDKTVSPSGAPDASRPVLLASVDGDAHVLPLYVLAALLIESDVRVRLLGASTPLLALRAATRRLRPNAIFLWAQLASPMNSDFAAGVEDVRAGAAVVLGGPGWDGAPLPENIQRATSLDDAVHLLTL